MFIVRNVFIAKAGCASKLAAQLKEAGETMKTANHRILTDVTGDFNRVILEIEVESIGDYEKEFQASRDNPEFREKMKGYTDLWITGSREILRVL